MIAAHLRLDCLAWAFRPTFVARLGASQLQFWRRLEPLSCADLTMCCRLRWSKRLSVGLGSGPGHHRSVHHHVV